MINIWANNPIAPEAVKAANARLCPTLPMRRGAHQQPMKNPTKWADHNRPICVVLNPSAMPDKASSGPTPPDDSCNKATDRNKAAKEINIRIDFIFPQNAHLHRNEIDKRHVILRHPASMVQKNLGEH